VLIREATADDWPGIFGMPAGAVVDSREAFGLGFDLLFRIPGYGLFLGPGWPPGCGRPGGG
jgi:hypothetical protein